MNLSISNIAWTKEEDESAFQLMNQFGFTGIELAPSRIWNNPYDQPVDQLVDFKQQMRQRGFKIVSLQSLLFNQPNLTIFDSKEQRQETTQYLKKAIDFAHHLECGTLVFGSPKNRLVKDLGSEAIRTIACDFFYELGQYAYSKNTFFCIEPNPVEYQADYITKTLEAIDLVKEINSKGFALNIDCGTMTMNHEDYSTTILKSVPYAHHFHISEPHLVEITGDHHHLIVQALKESGYSLYCSIEMKQGLNPSNLVTVKRVLELVSSTYSLK